MKNKLLLVFFLYCLNFTVNAQLNNILLNENLKLALKNEQFSNAEQIKFKVSSSYQTEHNGVTHVYLNQVINGLEIFNSSSSMHFSKEGKLLVFNNQFINNANQLTADNLPKLAATDALKIGTAKEGLAVSTALTKSITDPDGKITWLDPQASSEKLFGTLGYLNKEGKLHLVWQIDFFSDETNDWWNMHIDANTGILLEQKTSTAHCNFSQMYQSGQPISSSFNFEEQIHQNKKSATGSYTIFPAPLESPGFGPRNTMSDIASTNASPFGWHDTNAVAGPEFTITRGNNVWAKEDTLNNNGTPNPGYSPDGGSTLTFDFPYSVDAKPNANLNTAITNLFYWNNLMHDIMFNYGFNEEAGNFQQKNYTAKGADKDFVNADAQDGSGTNNANFSSPVDGLNGRMQMYLWPTAAAAVSNTLFISSPASVSGTYSGPQSQFGSKLTQSGIASSIVLLKDSNATTSLGCGLIANAGDLNGKIALIDRGTCTLPNKVLAAQNAGAIAVIVIQNTSGVPAPMTGSNSLITIPSIMISKTNGNAIKTALQNGPVSAFLFDSSGNNKARIYDSDLDNGVIAHEFGHGISVRLTGGPANSSCLSNAEQAGEGWSDFFALAITTRAWEKSTSTARGIGTFVIDQDTNGLGIRAYRYSRNMSINPVTYKNVALNTEVHAVGFVFGSVLYDLFWDMIDKYGFDVDIYKGTGGNNKALQLVVDGLKLQPCSPGFIDSRNAIIKADSINNGGANYALIWKTFARRGMGYSALQGLSTNARDQVEKFDLPPGVTGMEDLNVESNIRIYPNPSKTQVTIDIFGGSVINKVEFYDIAGKLVQVQNFDKDALPSATLDIAGFEKGLYLVKIQTSNGSLCKKLLVD
ncbi:MAG: T9SS-dependent M36 family metallopeptidase [Bacteroidia bacterium]|nr:T9SS-dependent M36 family metallopeptidase [Bacteroidia bacterium]